MDISAHMLIFATFGTQGRISAAAPSAVRKQTDMPEGYVPHRLLNRTRTDVSPTQGSCTRPKLPLHDGYLATIAALVIGEKQCRPQSHAKIAGALQAGLLQRGIAEGVAVA